MNFASVIKDQETEIAIQNCGEERKIYNPGLRMSAGIKTNRDDDENDQKRFQRRHFPYKRDSDILFNDLPSEDIECSENSAHRENLHFSAGIERRDADQKQSDKRHFDLPPEDCMQSKDTANEYEQADEKRHFHLPPEDCMQHGENGNEYEQVYSTVTGDSTYVESDETDDTEQKPTQKRHFHDKTSSNIFFCGFPPEDVASNPSNFRRMKI